MNMIGRGRYWILVALLVLGGIQIAQSQLDDLTDQPPNFLLDPTVMPTVSDIERYPAEALTAQPELLISADPTLRAAAFEALSKNPTLLQDPSILATFDEAIAADNQLLRDNPRLQRTWFQERMGITDLGATVSYDGQQIQLKKVDSETGTETTTVTLSSLDNPALKGATVTRDGRLLLQNRLEVEEGEVTSVPVQPRPTPSITSNPQLLPPPDPDEGSLVVRGGVVDATKAAGEYSEFSIILEGASTLIVKSGDARVSYATTQRTKYVKQWLTGGNAQDCNCDIFEGNTFVVINPGSNIQMEVFGRYDQTVFVEDNTEVTINTQKAIWEGTLEAVDLTSGQVVLQHRYGTLIINKDSNNLADALVQGDMPHDTEVHFGAGSDIHSYVPDLESGAKGTYSVSGTQVGTVYHFNRGEAIAYTVNPGDTLSSIAADLRQQGIEVTVEQLAAANGIEDPNQLVAGLELLLPATVETAIRLAEAYETGTESVIEIAAAEVDEVDLDVFEDEAAEETLPLPTLVYDSRDSQAIKVKEKREEITEFMEDIAKDPTQTPPGTQAIFEIETPDGVKVIALERSGGTYKGEETFGLGYVYVKGETKPKIEGVEADSSVPPGERVLVISHGDTGKESQTSGTGPEGYRVFKVINNFLYGAVKQYEREGYTIRYVPQYQNLQEYYEAQGETIVQRRTTIPPYPRGGGGQYCDTPPRSCNTPYLVSEAGLD